MKVELRAYLLAQTPLTTLIGQKLFIHQGSQVLSVVPYIVFQRIPDINHHHHMEAAAGLVQEFYQFDVFSSTATNTETVAEQLREELDGFRGFMDTENVRSIHLDDEDDVKVNPTDGSDDSKYRIRHVYRLTRTESVRTFT